MIYLGKTRNTVPSRKYSKGYTLIELMISVSLGLAMMSVAMQYLVGSSASFSATESAGRTQENGRFALSMITDELRMAGYGDPNAGARPGFFYTEACGGFDPCTANGANTDADRIAVWSDPPPDDGTETDCTASALAANAQVANVYYLETDATSGVTSLMCRGFDVTAGAWNATAQPLIDGIDNMQILYGVTAAGDISRYISADAVADWSAVISVRLALLVSTGMENGSSGLDTRTYELIDAPELEYEDAFNRSVFSTTVVINNALI